MCAVKDQAYQICTHTVKELDCDQHATCLLYAEKKYDNQFFSASARSTRKVYSNELGGSDFELCSPSLITKDLDYYIDASVTTSLENLSDHDNSNAERYLHSKDHTSLTPEAKDL